MILSIAVDLTATYRLPAPTVSVWARTLRMRAALAPPAFQPNAFQPNAFQTLAWEVLDTLAVSV